LGNGSILVQGYEKVGVYSGCRVNIVLETDLCEERLKRGKRA
jgi:hypothetical protein